MTNESEFWNRRREQLQETVRKSALDLFEHTGSNSFRLLLEPPHQKLWVSAGPASEPVKVTNPCAHEIGPWPGGQQWPRCLKCEIEQLRGNLSLAEEGLANATQESASLTIQRDHWLEIARQKDSLIDTQDAAQTSLHAENVRLREENEQLLSRLEGSQAAATAGEREIERLQAEMRSQHAAYQRMFDKAAELERRLNASEPSERHPFGNGTRVSLLRAIHTLRMPHVGCLGDAAQLEELLTWLGPDTRELQGAPRGAGSGKSADECLCALQPNGDIIETHLACPLHGYRPL